MAERQIDPETGCNVGCPCKSHPKPPGLGDMQATRTDRFATVTHRLVCRTCGCETSVAVGDMNPVIVEMFKGRHFPPHHDVLDEHLTDGLTEAGTDDHA